MYQSSQRNRTRTLTRELHPQEGLEEDDRDELLGSQLEKELNRSIEKMREDEEKTTLGTEDSGGAKNKWALDLEGACKSSPHGSPTSPPANEEMLEDIEMPTLISASFHDSVELVSLSFSNSPPKSIQLGSQDSVGTSLLQHMATGEKDVFEKVEALSMRSPTKFENLVNIEEDRLKCQGVSPSGGDHDGNRISSQLSPPEPRMTLGAGIKLLDISSINDSLLTRSPLVEQTPCEKVLALSPIQDQSDTKDLVQVEPVRGGDDHFLSSSVLLSEAKNVIAALQLTDSDFSQGASTTVPSIDIENVTDDLLSGISMLKSPEKKMTEEAKCSQLEKEEEVVETKPPEVKTDVSFTCENPNQPENPSTSYVVKTKAEGIKTNALVDQMKDKEIQHLNATFDKQSGNVLHEMLAQNDTFILNNVGNMTFDKNDSNNLCLGINTTFDKKDGGNACDNDNAVNATFVQQPLQSEKEQLNVTFEKGGEYKIGSLNETVNLMDAEEQVLQIILDATPKKSTRASIGHISTPKSSAGLNQPGLNSSGIVDPNKTFLRRSLGGRVENLSRGDCTQTDQTVGRPHPMFGLKLREVGQQVVASQLRRLQGGGPPTRAGPMKALPMKSVTTSQALNGEHGSTDTLPENCDGVKTSSDDAVGAGNSGSGAGGLGSFETERPGTPVLSSMVVGMSTPDVFRRGSEGSGPRITSTPTTKCEVPFSMDGPIPTPISRCRMISIASTVSSDASPPIAKSNGRHISEASIKQSEKNGVSSLHAEHLPAVDSCLGACSHNSNQQDVFVSESTQNKNIKCETEVPETTHKKDGVLSDSNQYSDEKLEIAILKTIDNKDEKQVTAAPESNHAQDEQPEVEVKNPTHNKEEVVGFYTAASHETEANTEVLKMKSSGSDQIRNTMADDGQSQNKGAVNLKCSNEDSPPMPVVQVCEGNEHNLAHNTTHSLTTSPREQIADDKQSTVTKSSKKRQPQLGLSKPKSTPSKESNKENKRTCTVAAGHSAVKPKTVSPTRKRAPSPRLVLRPSDSNIRKTNCNNKIKLKSDLKPLKTLQPVNRKNVMESKSALPSKKSASTIPTPKSLSDQKESVPPSLKLPSKLPSKFQSSSRLEQPVGALKLAGTKDTLGTKPVTGARSALPRLSVASHKPSLLRAPKPVAK